MKYFCCNHRWISPLVLATLIIALCVRVSRSAPHKTQPETDRGLGVQQNLAQGQKTQSNAGPPRPEIVLQAGITSPQIQIAFSPEGRLLASMAKDGNSIKLWEVASGRVLRQLESSIPSLP